MSTRTHTYMSEFLQNHAEMLDPSLPADKLQIRQNNVNALSGDFENFMNMPIQNNLEEYQEALYKSIQAMEFYQNYRSKPQTIDGLIEGIRPAGDDFLKEPEYVYRGAKSPYPNSTIGDDIVHTTISLDTALEYTHNNNYMNDVHPLSHKGASIDSPETYVGFLYRYKLPENTTHYPNFGYESQNWTGISRLAKPGTWDEILSDFTSDKYEEGLFATDESKKKLIAERAYETIIPKTDEYDQYLVAHLNHRDSIGVKVDRQDPLWQRWIEKYQADMNRFRLVEAPLNNLSQFVEGELANRVILDEDGIETDSKNYDVQRKMMDEFLQKSRQELYDNPISDEELANCRTPDTMGSARMRQGGDYPERVMNLRIDAVEKVAEMTNNPQLLTRVGVLTPEEQMIRAKREICTAPQDDSAQGPVIAQKIANVQRFG